MGVKEGFDIEAETDILRVLKEYIAIPSTSPAHDAAWKETGHLLAAAEKAREWIQHQQLEHARVEVSSRGAAPAVLVVIDTPQARDTILIHGHLGKEPAVGQWTETEPYTLKCIDDKLYGLGVIEGSAALVCAVLAVKAAQTRARLPHRVVILLDTFGKQAETRAANSYSAFKEAIGDPQLVVYLGAPVPDDQRLYRVTSARGAFTFELSADVLKENVHSGVMGGLVPDGVQTLLKALDTFEDCDTGALPAELSVDIPVDRYGELVKFLQAHDWKWSPALPTLCPLTVPPLIGVRRNTWEAALTVVGQRGLPSLGAASNVIRKGWTLILHMNIPPTLPCLKAQQAVEEHFLRHKQPYNAHMRVEALRSDEGFNQPATSERLLKAVNDASLKHFERPALACGSGIALPGLASIFELLGPKPAYLVSGTGTFASNIGGPNQSVSLTALKRMINAYADILADFSSA